MDNILPGILEKEWSKIEEKIELIRSFTKTIHIDLLDGKFAPNTTWMDPAPFKKYSDEIFFELHMMVDNPIQYVKPFGMAGFKRFLGHVEMMPDQVEFVAKGQELGEVGLAIDGPTPLDAIKVPYDDLDQILIMTIKAGFSGQSLMSEHLEKVRTLRQVRGVALPIEIDGGVNKNTIGQAKNVGVNRFAVTSGIFKEHNPEEAYSTLQSLI